MTAEQQPTTALALGRLRAACDAIEEQSDGRAIELATAAIEAEPGAAEVRIAAAHLLFVARSYDRSFDVLRQADVGAARASQAAALGALLAHRLNRDDEREEFLLRCPSPNAPALEPARVRVALAKGDRQAARAAARAHARRNENDADAWLILAEATALSSLESPEKSDQKDLAGAVKRALTVSRSPQTVMRAANALATVRLVRAARSIVDQALARNAGHEELLQIQQRLGGDPLEAAANGKQALLAAAARTPSADQVHGDNTADDLAIIRALVDQVAGRSAAGPVVPSPAGAPDPKLRTEPLPRPLDEAAIAHFVTHGWVRLSDAFPRATADAWRARAVGRIRTEPEKCVRGYQTGGDAADEHGVAKVARGDEASPDFSRFDVEDPGTWHRSRIDYSGELSTPYPVFSEKLWGAVDQLIGVDRLQTREIGEYLILNLSMGAGTPYRSEKRWASWHLDAPSTEMRFDNMRAGLLLVLLFSDVGPRMGATAIAPESVAEVARHLAARPKGVDFVAQDAGDEVMASCKERVFLEGLAGDAYLLHPLMMHSVAPNPSGKIRWMANPILFLHGSLKASGVQLTPVEEAIARAVS